MTAIRKRCQVIFSAAVLLMASISTSAQNQDYQRVVTERAHKIVAALKLTDSTKFLKVRKLVADQYSNLNDIYTRRDDQINPIKKAASSRDSINLAVQAIDQKTTTAIDSLHPFFLSRLSKELNTQQVTAIKDGMTYGVLPITYNGYTEMIPELNAPQKDQIMKWLVEAREHAMDAESSEKKHAWFGKYKGRINNYLSGAGYDLKKAGADWEKRRNAAKAVSGN